MSDADELDYWGFGEDEYAVHDCGYPEGSFACRIRHIQINTGAAKAAND